MRKTRVLIVDDSSFVRLAISESLSRDPEVEVVGTAANGRIALARLKELQPDIVTLDVDMPEMDGLDTLRELKSRQPNLPVIMCSALTEKGAATTLDALALGAACYVTKPSQTEGFQESLHNLRHDLLPKIKALTSSSASAIRALRKGLTRPAPESNALPSAHPSRPLKNAPPPLPSLDAVPTSSKFDIVVIGTSTGGPNALATLLSTLPRSLPVPVAIVQHMPALFTRLVAERLNAQTQLSVKEASHGDLLTPGGVWIAPGDQHMELFREGESCKALLNQDPPECFCRPSVNQLFRSAAAHFGPNVLAVILTGMGNDGTEGARWIREAGGCVIAQDEASSVVWGMPGSVCERGLANIVLPIESISKEITLKLTPRKSR